MEIPSRFIPPPRLLLGPGPSNAAPSILEALGRPLVGHLDPVFIRLMEETKEMLRLVFQTKNLMTFPVSGTGSAGMEFCFVNLVEPGDRVLIGVNGVFGGRMAEVAERCGAEVTKVEAPWGQIIEPGAVQKALEGGRFKLVALVHAETSTGVLSPAEEIARIVKKHEALLVLDTVTSLGGHRVAVDEWGVDAVYSGTQKCLNCPPGLAPVSFSPRAVEAARRRKKKVQSWYLDINLLAAYWGEERVYHHTAPISMNYALHEALRLVLEEGLETRWARHRKNHLLLRDGLGRLGLELAAQKGHELWPLNPVSVPAGVDEAQVRKAMLNDHRIEIGAGLGPLKGKIWRIGLMGENSRPEVVERLLSALDKTLGPRKTGVAGSGPAANTARRSNKLGAQKSGTKRPTAAKA